MSQKTKEIQRLRKSLDELHERREEARAELERARKNLKLIRARCNKKLPQTWKQLNNGVYFGKRREELYGKRDRLTEKQRRAHAAEKAAKKTHERAEALYNDAHAEYKRACVDLIKALGAPINSPKEAKIRLKPDEAHLYFGGRGAPDGPWHGHWVIDGNEVTYRRNPGVRP